MRVNFQVFLERAHPSFLTTSSSSSLSLSGDRSLFIVEKLMITGIVLKYFNSTRKKLDMRH